MQFFVQAANLPVSAKFYAALDATDKLTWTDDPWQAQRFDTMVDAEAFARAWIDGDDWVVKPVPTGEPIHSWAALP